MKKSRIRVQEVGPGVFSRERSVSFQVGDKHYTLIVDQDDVGEDNTLAVNVIAEGEHEALIDLPRDTFTTGNRIRIPKHYLVPA